MGNPWVGDRRFRRREPLFVLLGFPVYVPVTVWVGIALIASVNAPTFADYGGTVSTIAFAVGLYITVLIHELAHALVARHTGHHVTAIELGIFGGATSFDAERHPNPKHELRVAAVGPLTSIALGFAITFVLPQGEPSAPVAVLAGLGFMNVALGLLNLLPAAPLDGGHVCEAIVWRLTGSRRRGMRVTAVLGYVLGSLMFMSGLGDLGTVTGAWLALLGFILMTNAVSLWAASRVLRS